MKHHKPALLLLAERLHASGVSNHTFVPLSLRSLSLRNTDFFRERYFRGFQGEDGGGGGENEQTMLLFPLRWTVSNPLHSAVHCLLPEDVGLGIKV